jgi:anti-sigma regulatory factor (Ser/Thr protein kinase)
VQEVDLCGVLDLVDTSPETEPDAGLRLRLDATPAAASTLRAELHGWLSGLGSPPDEILDLQLACSEALRLVIREAAPPDAPVVDVEATLRDAVVVVTIRDHGLHRADVRREPGRDEAFSLALIHAMVDDLDVRLRRDGRTMVLIRRRPR